MSDGGKGDDRRPAAERDGYQRGHDQVDWHRRDAERLHALVKDGVRWLGVDFTVRHDRSMGWVIQFPEQGVSCGGKVTADRSLEDLAAIAVERIRAVVAGARAA